MIQFMNVAEPNSFPLLHTAIFKTIKVLLNGHNNGIQQIKPTKTRKTAVGEMGQTYSSQLFRREKKQLFSYYLNLYLLESVAQHMVADKNECRFFIYYLFMLQ